jgi:AraC-like DNA-binding protein
LIVAIGSIYRPFLEVAREAGVDTDAELARFGIREAELSEVRLPPLHGRALVLRLAALCGERELGLEAATRAQLTDLDLLGYLARHGEHALAALEAVARYPSLLGDTAECQIERSNGLVTVTFGRTGGQRLVPDGSDFATAMLYRMILELSGGLARPLEVWLPRPRPRRPAAYRAYFGVLPVFATEHGLLRYEESALLHAVPGSDRRLHKILEERAVESVAALPGDAALLNRVRAELERSLDLGACDITSIAARCGLSERTLRRQLDAAGTTFRKLGDDVRRQRALQLIDEGETKITTIAQATGYTDGTAFARAFRRWTGLAPQKYLARHQPGDRPDDRLLKPRRAG